MMRFGLTLLAALGLGLNLGCSPRSEGGANPSTAAPSLLAHYHFVGISQLSTNANTAKLKAIWKLPATRVLTDEILERLARAPEAWFTAPGQPAAASASALVRPLLDDLLSGESYGEWRGQTNRLVEWTLALKLNAERSRLWETNWRQLALAWHFGAPEATGVEGFPGWETRGGRTGRDFWFVRAGDWTVLGAGSDGLAGQTELLARIRARGPLGTEPGDDWLEAGADLSRLKGWVSSPATMKWPEARLRIRGQDEDLRTRMTLRYPEPMAWPTNSWQIPATTIRAPLISFTAARGIAPWLNRFPWIQAMNLPSMPDELFIWAQQSQIPAQTFAALPLPAATNALGTIALHVRDTFATNLVQHKMGQFRWVTNRAELGWLGLPFVVPTLQAVQEPAGQFLLASLFPPLPSTNPPPPELIAQVAERTNLLYYDWEITEERVIHWRAMTQLYSIIAAAWHRADPGASNHPPESPEAGPLPDEKAPTQVWLQAVAPLLGNTITRGNVTSPREVTFERKSPLSLTAFELVMLTRVLEDPAFLPLGRPAAAAPARLSPPPRPQRPPPGP